MSILLGLLALLQVMTMAYLIRRLGLHRPKVNQREAVTNVVNNSVEEAEQRMEARLLEYVDSQLAEYREAINELSEHIDGVVEIVTSVAEEASTSTENITSMMDRVNRLAYTASSTKTLLDKTIDAIDWEDTDPQPTPLPLVYDPIAPAPVEEYQRPFVPPAPPQPAPVQPREIEPPVDSVPLVGPRSETDPLITDLRAVPFQDHPDAYNDMHTLPPSAEYEEFGSPGRGRRSSRSNGLRQRLG